MEPSTPSSEQLTTPTLPSQDHEPSTNCFVRLENERTPVTDTPAGTDNVIDGAADTPDTPDPTFAINNPTSDTAPAATFTLRVSAPCSSTNTTRVDEPTSGATPALAAAAVPAETTGASIGTSRRNARTNDTERRRTPDVRNSSRGMDEDIDNKLMCLWSMTTSGTG